MMKQEYRCHHGTIASLRPCVQRRARRIGEARHGPAGIARPEHVKLPIPSTGLSTAVMPYLIIFVVALMLALLATCFF